MVEKIYVVMRDCGDEGDEIYLDKFYTSEAFARSVADSLIRQDLNGHITKYYYVKELVKGNKDGKRKSN